MKSHSSHDLHLLTSPGLWLCAVAAAFTMATAHANTPDDLSVPSNAQSMSAKQAFEHDKAYCQGREKTEDRATCLKEANRAYQEARAGKLEPGDSTHAASHSHRKHMAKSKTADQSSSSGTSDASTSNSSKQ